jgi:2-polyprenyl-3-methyl-5-hydroxy-6-metoxy-1,4-benzoquinol methylase
VLTCLCGAKDDNTPFLTGTYRRGLANESRDFAVVKCRRCGLKRTLPVPDETQYEVGMAATTSEGVFAGATTDLWSNLLVDMVDRFGSLRGRVLDVGCHSGNFVEAARRRGYEATGVDPDPIATAAGRDLGRPLLTGTLDQIDDASVDVVMMNHVLEHIESVDAALADIHRVLAPGGLLFILVPNHRGLIPRIMKDHWFAYMPTEHVWQFTTKTLTDAVTRRRQFEPVSVVAGGSIEPPSGSRSKAALQALSRVLRWGDQVEGVFRRLDQNGP